MDLGIAEADDAIVKSYKWLFGNNQLKTNMILDEPFFIYRSLHREGRFEREKRYIHAVWNTFAGMSARQSRSSLLKIDTTCRSYHLGWILFVWSDRKDFNDFLNFGEG